MTVSTKRKNISKSKSKTSSKSKSKTSSKSNKGSSSRKHLIKSRKSGIKTRKMRGGNRLNVYSFKVIGDVEEEGGFGRDLPVLSHRIVYSESIDKARTFIKDHHKFVRDLKGNIKGYVKGEKSYKGVDNITIKDFDIMSFNRNIKTIGTAPDGAIEGIVDLDTPDKKVATQDELNRIIHKKIANRKAMKNNNTNEPINTTLFN
jgi:hypothetical protein